MKKLINFFKDDEGATMVEYGLMVALVAVFLIVAVTAMRDQLAVVFNAVATALAGAITPGGGGGTTGG